MAKSKSNRRLFEADGYTFKRWLEPDEAEQMFLRGFIDIAIHPESGKPIGYKLRESFEKANPSRPRPSQSSITLSETLLNVGIPRRSHDPLNLQAVEAAKDKIQMWPITWDRKATIRVEMKKWETAAFESV